MSSVDIFLPQGLTFLPLDFICAAIVLRFIQGSKTKVFLKIIKCHAKDKCSPKTNINKFIYKKMKTEILPLFKPLASNLLLLYCVGSDFLRKY